MAEPRDRSSVGAVLLIAWLGFTGRVVFTVWWAQRDDNSAGKRSSSSRLGEGWRVVSAGDESAGGHDSAANDEPEIVDDPAGVADPAHDDDDPLSLADPAHDDGDPLSLADPAHDDDDPLSLADPAHDDDDPLSLADPAHDDDDPAGVADPAHDDDDPLSLADPAHDDDDPLSLADPAHDDDDPLSLADPAHDDDDPLSLADPAHDDDDPAGVADPAHDDDDPGGVVNSPHHQDLTMDGPVEILAPEEVLQLPAKRLSDGSSKSKRAMTATSSGSKATEVEQSAVQPSRSRQPKKSVASSVSVVGWPSRRVRTPQITKWVPQAEGDQPVVQGTPAGNTPAAR